jgi:hypothetical protein
MRFGAAILMGLAIAGMHYSGMMAANFRPEPMSHHGVNGNWLAVLVSVVAFSILGITLLVSMLDARLQARTSQLLLHWRKRTASCPTGATRYPDAPA